MKIEEQKRLREEILKQKELRRQQQAGARKRELLERLAQQQQQQQPCSQQSYVQHEEDSSEFPTNGSPYIPHAGLQTRHNMKNRLLVRKQDAVVANIHPKTSDFPQGAGDGQYQGQQMKPVKQLRQTRTVPAGQPQAPQKALPSKPAAAALPTPQAPRVASVPARPQEQKPGVKRTVMQRTNSGSDGPHVGSKVRVIKLSGGVSLQGSSHLCVSSWFVSVCLTLLCNPKIKNGHELMREVTGLAYLILYILYFQNYNLLAVIKQLVFPVMLYCQAVTNEIILKYSFKLLLGV